MATRTTTRPKRAAKKTNARASARASTNGRGGAPAAGGRAKATADRRDSLTVTDNRTGKTYDVPIEDGTVRAIDFRQIRTSRRRLRSHDVRPGVHEHRLVPERDHVYRRRQRASCEYRGYPIEQLAEKSTYLETAYLLVYGELPTTRELEQWTHDITYSHDGPREHQEVHRWLPLRRAPDGDAHRHGRRASRPTIPTREHIDDPDSRELQTWRLIAKMPTIAAFAYRHSRGLPFVYPDNDLSFTGNFLSMICKMSEAKYSPDPVLERAIEVLFILHADHEQNCSANAMRAVGSSRPDPYSATAAAAAALYGPLHGGANEEVLRMLDGDRRQEANVPEFIKKVKRGEGRLMGFGHRVYKNYDPRAKIIKRMADEVFDVTGRNPLLDIALELERIALEDDYFVSRKLYPNVDFYSGIIYQALGFPVEMFPVLFAIPRTAGWIAQWREMITDPEQKIARPRQIYTGTRGRKYQPIAKRPAHNGAQNGADQQHRAVRLAPMPFASRKADARARF